MPTTLSGAPRETTIFTSFRVWKTFLQVGAHAWGLRFSFVRIHCVHTGGWGGLGSNFLRLHAAVPYTAANMQHTTALRLSSCLVLLLRFCRYVSAFKGHPVLIFFAIDPWALDSACNHLTLVLISFQPLSASWTQDP